MVLGFRVWGVGLGIWKIGISLRYFLLLLVLLPPQMLQQVSTGKHLLDDLSDEELDDNGPCADAMLDRETQKAHKEDKRLLKQLTQRHESASMLSLAKAKSMKITAQTERSSCRMGTDSSEGQRPARGATCDAIQGQASAMLVYSRPGWSAVELSEDQIALQSTLAGATQGLLEEEGVGVVGSAHGGGGTAKEAVTPVLVKEDADAGGLSYSMVHIAGLQEEVRPPNATFEPLSKHAHSPEYSPDNEPSAPCNGSKLAVAPLPLIGSSHLRGSPLSPPKEAAKSAAKAAFIETNSGMALLGNGESNGGGPALARLESKVERLEAALRQHETTRKGEQADLLQRLDALQEMVKSLVHHSGHRAL